MKTEIKVGIFVLLALISIIFLTFQIKSLENFKQKGYTLYAIVKDASGVTKKSRVKMRGVKIGIVKGLKLIKSGVKLKLLIYNNVKIPKNSAVALAQDNILGGKYLEIIPSNSNEYYKPGDIITHYINSASMGDVMTNINEAVNKIKILIDKLNKTLDKNTTENIKMTIANIKQSSIYLKDILKTTDTKLPKILNNTNSLVLTYKQSGEIIKKRLPLILNKTDSLLAKLNNIGETLKQKLPKLIDEYAKVGENANSLLIDNKTGIKQTIIAAKNFFTNGSNSFEKLDKFLGSVEKSQINVDISTNYLSKDNYFKTTANLAYMPNPTKYYIIGVTTKNDYSTQLKANSKTTKAYINAEIGKRYDNLLIRGGIIQNTGGVGVDYFMNKDLIKLSSDLYDFNHENDYRGNNPHLDIYGRYLYLKHLEFIAGIDDILNTDARQFFLGIGINFYDNDLKTLVSGGAASFLK